MRPTVEARDYLRPFYACSPPERRVTQSNALIGMSTPNGPFYLTEPEPHDNRPRNAFGFLVGFGRAYSDYYARKEQSHVPKANQEQVPQADHGHHGADCQRAQGTRPLR